MVRVNRDSSFVVAFLVADGSRFDCIRSFLRKVTPDMISYDKKPDEKILDSLGTPLLSLQVEIMKKLPILYCFFLFSFPLFLGIHFCIRSNNAYFVLCLNDCLAV